MALIDTISFVNRSGVMLAGKLNKPVGQRRGVALFAHCFTCAKDSLAAVRIAQGLAERGIAVFRFDFTGLGQSEGDFATSGFRGNLDDLEDAAQWMSTHYGAPELLIGHSLGGAAVLALAARMPEIKGIVTIGAPAQASHVMHLFENHLDEIREKGRAEVSIGGRPFELSSAFVDDLAARTSLDHITKLRCDLLILHAPQDMIVGIENAAEIFSAAKHPKSFVSLDKADHLLTKRADADFAAAMIAAHASRLFSQTPHQAKAREGEVVVTSSPDGPFAHNIAAGMHQLRADEPASITGGLDSGPAPYDFLLAGLGACTAMTLRMYAMRKNWPLEGVEVRLFHEKTHLDDTANAMVSAEKKGAKIDHMRREIAIEGALDDAQIARLIEIANKCPVHKTLEEQVIVTTKLADR